MNHSARFVTTHFGRPCIIDETQLIERRESQKLFSGTVLVAAVEWNVLLRIYTRLPSSQPQCRCASTLSPRRASLRCTQHGPRRGPRHGRPPYRAEVLHHDPLPRRSALARSEHSPTRRERVARTSRWVVLCHALQWWSSLRSTGGG